REHQNNGQIAIHHTNLTLSDSYKYHVNPNHILNLPRTQNSADSVRMASSWRITSILDRSLFTESSNCPGALRFFR
ncbi:MAG: hypothetical protein OEU63_06025, partial [Gammaproteobacteria bacterium]|nr:hypothetical protein [Gammaproteobacteria bacterium]